jgi:hypothetical protein
MRTGVWIGIVSSALLCCAYGVPTTADAPSPDDAGPPSAQPQGRDLNKGPIDVVRADASSSTSDASDGDVIEASLEAGSSWMSPTCDGVVTEAEYGGTDNQMPTPTGQTWFLTWDATALYVAITGANVDEALVLYVGHSAPGASMGQPYDDTGIATLGFPASAVVYAKASYDEVRTVTNATWTKTGSVTVCVSGDATTRELVIPWSATGSSAIPASFRWMGYLTSATGYVYGQLPGSNPGKLVGLSASFPHDYFVASTSDGFGAFPFADPE